VPFPAILTPGGQRVDLPIAQIAPLSVSTIRPAPICGTGTWLPRRTCLPMKMNIDKDLEHRESPSCLQTMKPCNSNLTRWAISLALWIASIDKQSRSRAGQGLSRWQGYTLQEIRISFLLSRLSTEWEFNSNNGSTKNRAGFRLPPFHQDSRTTPSNAKVMVSSPKTNQQGQHRIANEVKPLAPSFFISRQRSLSLLECRWFSQVTDPPDPKFENACTSYTSPSQASCSR